MEPKIVIILVNYNGFDDTIDCLISIEKITYENYIVVVVDNGSTVEPSVEQLEYIRTHAVYIANGDNLGFSGGNNIGIQYANSIGYDYILLLNNDTIVNPDFLTELVACAQVNERVGVIGGKIYYHDEPVKLWYSGGEYNLIKGVASHNTTEADKTEIQREVSFITGCLMLIPKQTVADVGLLAEDYFLYAEDTDYCCRVREKELRLIYCNRAVIYHKVSASTGKGSPLAQYYERRNNLYLIKKYGQKKAYAYVYNIARDIRNIIFRGSRLKSVVAGYIDFCKDKMGRKEML